MEEQEEKKETDGEVVGSMKVMIKFSGRSIRLLVTPESTVLHLKTLLQPLSNLLIRGQKLIFKGKVLTDTMTLKSLQITDGSKIMLVASQGLHQGDGPITKDAPTSLISKKVGETNRAAHNIKVEPVSRSRVERWKVTGVVALSECHLKDVPDEVCACEATVRVLDLSNNFIKELPSKVGSLGSLQKLLLNVNEISDDGISWDVITSFKHLTFLSMNQNHLTTLPAALGALTSLQQLHVANNKLTNLPNEIGLLSHLQVFKANNNRINLVPSSIGNCSSLVEVDLSSNLLVDLPEMLGNLQNLKTLLLSNNGLKALPLTLFKSCLQLSTLDLHGTEITMNLLREFDGWKDFDERRRLKHQKQLDFRAGSSGVFDEGADKNVGP